MSADSADDHDHQGDGYDGGGGGGGSPRRIFRKERSMVDIMSEEEERLVRKQQQRSPNEASMLPTTAIPETSSIMTRGKNNKAKAKKRKAYGKRKQYNKKNKKGKSNKNDDDDDDDDTPAAASRRLSTGSTSAGGGATTTTATTVARIPVVDNYCTRVVQPLLEYNAVPIEFFVDQAAAPEQDEDEEQGEEDEVPEEERDHGDEEEQEEDEEERGSGKLKKKKKNHRRKSNEADQQSSEPAPPAETSIIMSRVQDLWPLMDLYLTRPDTFSIAYYARLLGCWNVPMTAKSPSLITWEVLTATAAGALPTTTSGGMTGGATEAACAAPSEQDEPATKEESTSTVAGADASTTKDAPGGDDDDKKKPSAATAQTRTEPASEKEADDKKMPPSATTAEIAGAEHQREATAVMQDKNATTLVVESNTGGDQTSSDPTRGEASEPQESSVSSTLRFPAELSSLTREGTWAERWFRKADDDDDIRALDSCCIDPAYQALLDPSDAQSHHQTTPATPTQYRHFMATANKMAEQQGNQANQDEENKDVSSLPTSLIRSLDWLYPFSFDHVSGCKDIVSLAAQMLLGGQPLPSYHTETIQQFCRRAEKRRCDHSKTIRSQTTNTTCGFVLFQSKDATAKEAASAQEMPSETAAGVVAEELPTAVVHGWSRFYYEWYVPEAKQPPPPPPPPPETALPATSRVSSNEAAQQQQEQPAASQPELVVLIHDIFQGDATSMLYDPTWSTSDNNISLLKLFLVQMSLLLEHARQCNVWYAVLLIPKDSQVESICKLYFRMKSVLEPLEEEEGAAAPPAPEGTTSEVEPPKKKKLQQVRMVCDIHNWSARYAFLKFQTLQRQGIDLIRGGTARAPPPEQNAPGLYFNHRWLVRLPSSDVVEEALQREATMDTAATAASTITTDAATVDEAPAAVVSTSMIRPVLPSTRNRQLGRKPSMYLTGGPANTRSIVVAVRARKRSEDEFALSFLKENGEEEAIASPAKETPCVFPDVPLDLMRNFAPSVQPKPPQVQKEENKEEVLSEIASEITRRQEKLQSLETRMVPHLHELMNKVVQERLAFEQQQNSSDILQEKEILQEFKRKLEERKEFDLALQRQLELDMEAVCDICNDGEVTPDNQILFCEACNVAVHQRCYGIEKIPPGDYYCVPCRHFGRKAGAAARARAARACSQTAVPASVVAEAAEAESLDLVCQLCPHKQGAFLKTTLDASADAELAGTSSTCAVVPSNLNANNNKAKKRDKWVHMVCAKWQGLNVVAPGTIEEVTETKQDFLRHKLFCYLCKSERGCMNNCRVANCNKWMHVTCARLVGNCEVVHGEDVHGNKIDTNPWSLVCAEHAQLEGKDPQKDPVSIETLREWAAEFPPEPAPPPEPIAVKPFNQATGSERLQLLQNRKYEAELLFELTAKKVFGSVCEVCCDVIDNKQRVRCNVCGVSFCRNCQFSWENRPANSNKPHLVTCASCDFKSKHKDASPPVDDPQCIACYQQDGLLRKAWAKPISRKAFNSRKHGEIAKTLFGKHIFCHMLCAMWNPKLQLDLDTGEVNCSNVVMANGRALIQANTRCIVCGQNGGLKMKCDREAGCRSVCVVVPKMPKRKAEAEASTEEEPPLLNPDEPLQTQETDTIMHLTCAKQIGLELSSADVIEDGETVTEFNVRCYRHGSNSNNLRAMMEDMIEHERTRAGPKLAKWEKPMNFADASKILHGGIYVLRCLGWAWRWAEWFVDFDSTWEPLLEEGQREEDMTKEQLKIVESTRESRAADVRKCRLQAFGAALRNRSYDLEGQDDFDRPAFDAAIRAILKTPSLVGPLTRREEDFFAWWLALAYWSKSRLLGFGEHAIPVNPQAPQCTFWHCKHRTPKFELGKRLLPGKEGDNETAEGALPDPQDDLLKHGLPSDGPKNKKSGGKKKKPPPAASGRGPGRPKRNRAEEIEEPPPPSSSRKRQKQEPPRVAAATKPSPFASTDDDSDAPPPPPPSSSSKKRGPGRPPNKKSEPKRTAGRPPRTTTPPPPAAAAEPASPKPAADADRPLFQSPTKSPRTSQPSKASSPDTKAATEQQQPAKSDKGDTEVSERSQKEEEATSEGVRREKSRAMEEKTDASETEADDDKRSPAADAPSEEASKAVSRAKQEDKAERPSTPVKRPGAGGYDSIKRRTRKPNQITNIGTKDLSRKSYGKASSSSSPSSASEDEEEESSEEETGKDETQEEEEESSEEDIEADTSSSESSDVKSSKKRRGSVTRTSPQKASVRSSPRAKPRPTVQPPLSEESPASASSLLDSVKRGRRARKAPVRMAIASHSLGSKTYDEREQKFMERADDDDEDVFASSEEEDRKKKSTLSAKGKHARRSSVTRSTSAKERNRKRKKYKSSSRSHESSDDAASVVRKEEDASPARKKARHGFVPRAASRPSRRRSYGSVGSAAAEKKGKKKPPQPPPSGSESEAERDAAATVYKIPRKRSLSTGVEPASDNAPTKSIPDTAKVAEAPQEPSEEEPSTTVKPSAEAGASKRSEKPDDPASLQSKAAAEESSYAKAPPETSPVAPARPTVAPASPPPPTNTVAALSLMNFLSTGDDVSDQQSPASDGDSKPAAKTADEEETTGNKFDADPAVSADEGNGESKPAAKTS